MNSASQQKTAEAFALFGPAGEEAYRRYAPKPPNDTEHVIAGIKASYGVRADGSNEQARSERLAFMTNYHELAERLDRSRYSAPVELLVYEFARERSRTAAEQLVTFDKGLGLHLKEIRQFSVDFFLNSGGTSAFPKLLNDRQAQLLAYVAAPIHDVVKFLGTQKAQVMADHEILGAELARNHFAGHKWVLDILTQEDADFVAAVIGDHENIFEEEGRREWIKSPDVIERARAMFMVADVLTGVIVRDGGSGWNVDREQLEKRFVDLYFRHIDPVIGKVFRPEWGQSTIQDLIETISEFKNSRNILGASSGESIEHTLKNAGVEAIDRALAADNERIKSGAGIRLSSDQRLRVEQVRADFERQINW